MLTKAQNRHIRAELTHHSPNNPLMARSFTMPRQICSFISFVLLTLQFLTVDATYYPKDKDPDLPGHSDKYEVMGSSGFGCQARDSEVISERTPDRSGEDDGTLWTGETILHINRSIAEEGEDTQTVCNGTFYMPTLFWMGPYLQGEDGTDNNFAMGMIAFETNNTNKSDTWHVYRPCVPEFDEPNDPPPGTYDPYNTAFELRGAVHYNSNAAPSDNTTIGLTLIPRPLGSEAPDSSSPQIFFNGTFNGVKETKEYLAESGLDFGGFSSNADLNCTRVSKSKDDGDDFDNPSGAYGTFQPGSPINGSLSNDTIVLHMTGSETYKAYMGVEHPTPSPTKIGVGRTDIDFTFTGRYDARNSSQSLILNTTSDQVITFSVGTRQWHPSISLLSGILVLLALCLFL